MKMLFAFAIIIGFTAGAMAGESYGDYRDYFDAKPVVVERTPPRVSEKKPLIDRRHYGTEERVERYRFDDGAFGRTPDVRPRSWDGGYVPMHPRSASPDGFWSPIDQSFEGRELRQQRFR